MTASETSLERARAAHRFLNGAPRGQLVLHGLSPATGHVALPPPRSELPGTLEEALLTRRSRYRFAEIPPSASDLSTLLRWALGPQRTVRLPDGNDHQMAMAPSAGGLPSLATYLTVRPGGEIPAGLFRYRHDQHLDILRRGDPTTALRSTLIQPEFAERSAIILILVARLDATLTKYPERHYRTLHIDAGIALQNLYLTAAATGLAGCAVTAFHDHALTELLQLSDTMFPVVLYCIGRP